MLTLNTRSKKGARCGASDKRKPAVSLAVCAYSVDNFSFSSSHFQLCVFPWIKSLQTALMITIPEEEHSEMWDWENEDYGLQTDVSNTLWSNANEHEDNLSYMFNETTPAKSFEDLTYQVTDNENINKGKEPYRAFSQAKRRRMLQFDNEVLDDVDMIPDLSSTYLKSKEREASLDGALSDITQWVDGFADENTHASGTSYEGLDQSSEVWLDDCLINDTEMHSTTDDLNPSGSTLVHIDLTDSNDSQSKNDHEIPTPTRSNIILKGKKSFIKTPTTRISSSVVLPFAFVKPCGMQGAVTLKDINQKILTPPLSKSKKIIQENVTKVYPTSAFSGKPVVGQTKIRTEGGKGSITIMRTKG